GAEIFQFQAIVVLLGMAGLGVLLLSDRARQTIHAFVVRHFSKAQHDSVRTWTMLSRGLASVTDQASICSASAKLIAETFDVLSVTIWLLDEDRGRLVAAGSTAPQTTDRGVSGPREPLSCPASARLLERAAPFDVEGVGEPWAEELRQLNPTTFP